MLAAAVLTLAACPLALESEILDIANVDMGYQAAFNVLCVGVGSAGDVVVAGVTGEGVDYMSRAFAVGLGPGWDVEYSGIVEGVNSGWINSVSPCWDGGCLCAGATDYAPDDQGDPWLVALDPGGFTRWQHHRDGGAELGEASWVSANGPPWLAAGYALDGSNRPRSWLVRVDNAGSAVSSGYVDLDGFRAIAACTTFAGETVLVGSRYGQAAAVMVDGSGELLWSDPTIAEGALGVVAECQGGLLSGGWAEDRGPMLCLHSNLGGSRWARYLEEEGYSGAIFDLAPLPGLGSALVITGSSRLVVCDLQGKPVGEVDPGFRPSAVAALEDGTLAVAGGGVSQVRLARISISR